ncbi:MAG: FHA domain-containing protein [Chloroflexi bacterium]|nr:FHA domain-containing protein [Chloroflexota bacterium]
MIGPFLLTEPETLIGRDPACQVALPLPPISRRHAAVRCSSAGCSLRDLGSANGTTLNGAPVGETDQPLRPGDLIGLAGAARLVFELAPAGSPLLRMASCLWIDAASHEVYVDGCRIEPPLSPAQFTLLDALFQAEGRLLSRSQIIAVVWPGVDPAGVSDEAVDGLVKRLRQRLRGAQGSEMLQSERGKGLRLVRL